MHSPDVVPCVGRQPGAGRKQHLSAEGGADEGGAKAAWPPQRISENGLTRVSGHDPMTRTRFGPWARSQSNSETDHRTDGAPDVNTPAAQQLNGIQAVAAASRGVHAGCAYRWSASIAKGNANGMFAHAPATPDTTKLRSWRLRKNPH